MAVRVLDWENPSIFKVNRERGNVPGAIPNFSSELQAINRKWDVYISDKSIIDACNSIKSLNGTWHFQWYRNPFRCPPHSHLRKLRTKNNQVYLTQHDTSSTNGPPDFSLDMVSSPAKSKFVATSEIQVSFGSNKDAPSTASEWPQPELLKLDRMQDTLDRMQAKGIQGSPLDKEECWNSIQVPGSWQTQGFDIPRYTNIQHPFLPAEPPVVPRNHNPVAVYVTGFDIPQQWNDKALFLVLDAVKSAFYIWIDGNFLGYSQDSMTPKTFRIDNKMTSNDTHHTITIQVFRWSDGSYIEDQDCWDMSGIHRDVFIYAVDKQLYIRDYELRTNVNLSESSGSINCNFWLRSVQENLTTEFFKSYSISLKIYRNGTLLSSERKDLDGSNISVESQSENGYTCHEIMVAMETSIMKNIELWSAENPAMYQVIILLENSAEKVPKQILSDRIGFRTVELTGGRLVVNGAPIKIAGINRHEFDQRISHIIKNSHCTDNGIGMATLEDMVKDIQLMKQHNFNSVRNSHYPNHELWYQLCDTYGLYMVDETNLESHAFQDLTKDPEWKDQFLDRIESMVERNKNHTCIIIWSLGNEAGFGPNHVAMSKWVKSRDNTRLVLYEPARFDECVDIISPMYATVKDLPSYLRDDRPLILVEYAHSMGNSTGNLKEYWDFVYSSKNMQGGWIWDWVDQGLLCSTPSGQKYFTYGGDFMDVPNDSNFCINGLIWPDRVPHPALMECKKVQQPIQVKRSQGNFSIFNGFFFTNLSTIVNGTWCVQKNGKSGVKHPIPESSLRIPPQHHQQLQIDYHLEIQNKEPCECFLLFEFYISHDTPWCEKGHLIAYEQFPIEPVLTSIPSTISSNNHILQTKVTKDGNLMTVENSHSVLVFDTQLGRIVEWKIDEKDVLVKNNTPVLNFWRPPTDNDIGGGNESNVACWKRLGLNKLIPTQNNVTVTSSSEFIQITTTSFFTSDATNNQAGFDSSIEYKCFFHEDSRLEIKCHVLPKGLESLLSLPRVGLRLAVPENMDTIHWYGRGPWENYPDRNSGAIVGRYTAKVSDMFTPYVYPPECGLRTDVRWLSCVDSAERGLLMRPLEGNQFHFSALHASIETIEAAKHTYEIPTKNHVYLCIDHQHLGVGGDNSWTPMTTLEQYRVSPTQPYNFGIVITRASMDIL